MLPAYYEALEKKYEEKGLSPKDLPLPCEGVPLTAKAWDYKTFYWDKVNGGLIE